MTEPIAKKKRVAKPKAEYSLSIKLNDKVFEFETNDLRASILSVKPQFLRTRVIISVEKKGVGKIERMLYLQQGKMLFINKYAMDALLKNLIF